MRSKKKPRRTKNEPNQRSNFHHRLENFGRLNRMKYFIKQKSTYLELTSVENFRVVHFDLFDHRNYQDTI
jgi:hypothetical protein